jgi:hypothetical protein
MPDLPSLRHTPRLPFLHCRHLILVVTVALAACSSFTGAPPLPTNLAAEVSGLAALHSTPQIGDCIKKAADQQTNCRDTIVQSRMIVIDSQYTQFRQNFYAEARWGGFAAIIASLALTTTAAFPGVAASTSKVLSGIATGVTGTRAAFEKDILVDRTATALETAMDAARNSVAVRIRVGLKADAKDYPLAVALSDLESYYNAGTLLGALANITEVVGVESARANNELRLAAGYERYTGFNTSAAAECIDKAANLPNPAGRDNRRKIEASLGTADWPPIIRNPQTDPQKIAAVAKAVGCPVQ